MKISLWLKQMKLLLKICCFPFFSFLFVCIPKKLDVAACVGIHYVPEYHVKLRCIGVVVLGCS